MAYRITAVPMVYSTVCSDADEKNNTPKLHVTGLCEMSPPVTGDENSRKGLVYVISWALYTGSFVINFSEITRKWLTFDAECVYGKTHFWIIEPLQIHVIKNSDSNISIHIFCLRNYNATLLQKLNSKAVYVITCEKIVTWIQNLLIRLKRHENISRSLSCCNEIQTSKCKTWHNTPIQNVSQ